MSKPLISKAIALFDDADEELSKLEADINHSNEGDGSYKELFAASHQHALALDELRSAYFNDPDAADQLSIALHAHNWHSTKLLQSAFIEHALRKPRGYPGDSKLMEIICEQHPLGKTKFAQQINNVYLQLPAAEAVRLRARALEKRFEILPPGAKVLNLACGPALEVESFLAKFPDREVEFLLLDHDPLTRAVFGKRRADARKELALANAFRIMKGDLTILKRRRHALGEPSFGEFNGLRKFLLPINYSKSKIQRNTYDLVYTSGLYDYVRYEPQTLLRGTTGLTNRLFSLVKPGGELLIGNFRLPGVVNNPHRPHHRTMMDIYSDWRLIYRTDDEIRGFAAAIPKESITCELFNESLAPIEVNGGSIAFLSIKRKI